MATLRELSRTPFVLAGAMIGLLFAPLCSNAASPHDGNEQQAGCDPQPCVDVVNISAPSRVCPGQPIDVLGSVRNCTSGPENIHLVLRQNGAVVEEITFTDVPAGESRSISARSPGCSGEPFTTLTLEAVAQTECGTSPVTSAQVVVECGPSPCVQVHCDAPQRVCVGQPFQLVAVAVNCSLSPETFVMTIRQDGVVLQTVTFTSVAAGESRSFQLTVPACTQPGLRAITVEAVATNECGKSVTEVSQCVVECVALPCVKVECEAPPPSCSGQPVSIRALAFNCSDAAEDITVIIHGPGGQILGNRRFVGVPAGGGVILESEPAPCVPGVTMQFAVQAQAENTCGQIAQDQSACVVPCGTLPCVDQVTCQIPNRDCSGEPIQILSSARNCGDQPADLTITIKNDVGAVIEQTTFVAVPPGQSRALYSDPIPCTAPGVHQFITTATAINECGTSQPVSAIRQVTCGSPPCVQVNCNTPPEVCAGETYRVTGAAQNCSTAPEDITVLIRNAAGVVIKTQTFPDVQAGETRVLLSDPITCPQPGQNPYTIEAFAENGCGTAVAQSTCTVICRSLPCVDQVTCQVPDQRCPDEPFQILSSARNCADRPADLTIMIKNSVGVIIKQATFVAVPPGDSRGLTSDPIRCEQGGPNLFVTEAFAENECGSSPPRTSTCIVECRPGPCVDQVDCQAPPEVCVNQGFSITAWVRNCSPEFERVTLILLQAGNQVRSFELDLAPGQILSIPFDGLSSPQPGVVRYELLVRALNDCGEPAFATDVCDVNVVGLPAVVAACSASVTEAVVGTPFVVNATGTNVSLSPVLLSVRLLDGQGLVMCSQDYPDVPPGESRTLSCPATCDGGPATFSAAVRAFNNCGGAIDQSGSCIVTCQSLCCWLTMGGGSGGAFAVGEYDHAFGGTVGPDPTGTWQHVIHHGATEDFRLESRDAQVTTCGSHGDADPCHLPAEASFVLISGSGSFFTADGAYQFPAYFEARVDDRGELGGSCSSPDKYSIKVWRVDAPSVHVLVLDVGGSLATGDFTILQCKDGLTFNQPEAMPRGRTATGKRPTDLSPSGTGSVSPLLELYRPSPNPFTETTTIAYAVGGVSGETVSIGIYDIAGRQVRELVNGFQAPGRYESVWNGRNDDGASVTKGVYFLRAYVGGVRVAEAARILYVR